jgi:hypothetical protein
LQLQPALGTQVAFALVIAFFSVTLLLEMASLEILFKFIPSAFYASLILK